MSTPIIKNTKLLPITRQKVKNLCKTIIKEKLTPWRSFKFYSVNITDFYGETHPIGGEHTAYEGPVESFFFNFIVPFLEDAIVNTLDETLETCRLRGLKPEESCIRETAMILDGYLIDPIYREMADIDRLLRCRDGNLKSVKRRDVTEEIDKMVKFLDKNKDELIQGIKEQNGISNQPQERAGQVKAKKSKTKKQERKFKPWDKRGDACFIIVYTAEGDWTKGIHFYHSDKHKNLRLRSGSRTESLLTGLKGKFLIPEQIKADIGKGRTKASDIVTFANKLLNEKTRRLGFTGLPDYEIGFIALAMGRYQSIIPIYTKDEFDRKEIEQITS